MPVHQQPPEHGDWAAAGHFPEAPIDAQLLVRHAHVHLVQLQPCLPLKMCSLMGIPGKICAGLPYQAASSPVNMLADLVC